MSDTFRYAPGKPGFGTKGEDGQTGLQGLSMYFTDYNTATQASAIRDAIGRNYVLWSSTPIDPLPDGRVYITGDLFVDTEGKVYEIDAENDIFTYKFGNLNTAGYFTYSEVDSDNGFKRYFNSNDTPKYIIDNVFSDGVIAYYVVPSDIYNIYPKNFTRIEYSNIVDGLYNPFTIYSAGERTIVDDKKALALVREVASNTFRFGNLSSDGSVRNVNLIFDVSSLKQNKVGNVFNVNTTAGSILSNYEIDANSLFSGVFDPSPLTFTSSFGSTNVSIQWIKADFTSDSNVTADLYFFDGSVLESTINFLLDASKFRPYVFHDINTSGSVEFTGLNEAWPYKYYIKFCKNGWERRSNMKTVVTGVVPVMSILPVTAVCSSGAYTGDLSVGFDVTSNVPWSADYLLNPGSFMSELNSYDTTGNGNVYVDLTENTADNPRIGKIRVSAINGGGNSPVDASIYQSGTKVPVTVTTTAGSKTGSVSGNHIDTYMNGGELAISGMPGDSVVDITITFNMEVINYNYKFSGETAYINNTISLSASGKTTQTYTWSDTILANGTTKYAPTTTITMTNVLSANLPMTIALHNYVYNWASTYYFRSYIDVVDVTVTNVSGTPVYSTYSLDTALQLHDTAQGG